MLYIDFVTNNKNTKFMFAILQFYFILFFAAFCLSCCFGGLFIAGPLITFVADS